MGRLTLILIYAVCIGLIITTVNGQTSCDTSLSDRFSGTECITALNNLRRAGSSSAACTQDCRQRFNSVFDCGFDTINTYTREDINDYCSRSAGGAASPAKGLSFMMILLAIAAAIRFVL